MLFKIDYLKEPLVKIKTSIVLYPFIQQTQHQNLLYLCNVVLEKKGNDSVLLTEDNSGIIEDETIVEFKYDLQPKFWQWTPIRVRLDKTADYRAGGRNYGNAYHVAQSVWNSIHNPVTHEMITTGEGIPDAIQMMMYITIETKGTITRALRNFHNLFVKRILILAVQNGTLIDMSVGKGGDFPKWIAGKLSFVFGLMFHVIILKIV